MSEAIYQKGYEAGYQRALEDDLREVRRFADMGKSAQEVAELLEYLLELNKAPDNIPATPLAPHA